MRFVISLVLKHTIPSLFFFTDLGKVFQTKVYEVPEGVKANRGRGLANFLEISNQENFSVLALNKKSRNNIKYLVMATKNGIVKKHHLEFDNVRMNGLIAIKLKSGDVL